MSSLSDELRPPIDGEKSLTIIIYPGRRPEVVFTGTWTGRYISAAMDSIAKAYRITRRRVIPPTQKLVEIQTQVKPEGGL